MPLNSAHNRLLGRSDVFREILGGFWKYFGNFSYLFSEVLGPGQVTFLACSRNFLYVSKELSVRLQGTTGLFKELLARFQATF